MGLMSFLFGKPSTSSNQAYGYLQGALSPNVSQGTGATSLLGDFLGLGGNGASAQAYNNFLNMSGYGQALNHGIDAVNTNMYARGLGKSGADLKGIEEFRTGLNSQYLNQYLSQLLGLGQLGNQSASIIGDAGGKSVDQSKRGPGAIELAGDIFSMLSDRRLKRDIVKVGEYSDGLGIYEYRYSFDPGRTRFRGVMADEVKHLRPWAHVPNFRDGYDGVNYAALDRAA